MTQDLDGGRESALAGVLARMYARVGNRAVRTLIRHRIERLEGGEMRSVTLRRIMREHYGVEIGLYTDGGCFVPFAFDPGTTIGRYCSIAYTAASFGANHPMNARSTHAVFYNPALGVASEDLLTRTRLVVGSDVWIGHNAIILNTCTEIGHGAVIGAGSVVARDVPPYAVVVGHPARVVRYRFSDEKIAELLEERWWERDLDDLLAEGLDEFQRPIEGVELR